MNETTRGDGYMDTLTRTGRTLARVSTLVANQDQGFVGVFNAATGANTAGMTGAGVVFGTSKSFVVDHPRDPGKSIIYTSLEGPTADLYVRGRVELAGDTIWVPFKSHFAALLSAPETLSIHLTALSAGCGRLYVGAIEAEGFEVHQVGETGVCRAGWLAVGLRAGYEHQPVVVDRDAHPFAATSAASALR
jgi:hypothetical protein